MARLASRSRLTVLASSLVIAYGASLLTYVVTRPGPVREAELVALDWRFLYRGPVPEADPRVVVVTVDEAADLSCHCPLGREPLAALVRALTAAGARLTGLDVDLGGPSAHARGDSLLAAAIREAGNVLLASRVASGADGVLREQLPDVAFLDGALDYGYGTLVSRTPAGLVRDAAVAIDIEGRHALSLAGCLYAHLSGVDTGALRQLEWNRRDDRLPGSDDDYLRLIDYDGPPLRYSRRHDLAAAGHVAVVSSRDLPAAAAAGRFRDRVVIVGSGHADAPAYRTPFSAREYGFEQALGAEVHAQFLATLLESSPLAWIGFFVAAVWVILPALLTAFASLSLRPTWAALLAAAVVALTWGLAFHLFAAQHTVVPVVAPSLACGLSLLAGVLFVSRTDGPRRQAVRDRLGPLVGEAQLQQILAQPVVWSPDGEERPVSVLWLALQPVDGDPTRATAHETTSFFQECWGLMSTVVFKHGGAVFHYEEDGLAAVFGAPLPHPGHPQAAVLAAVDAAEAWLGRRARHRSGERWRLGIGADTGLCVLGELAGDGRPAYRALGPPVDRARSLAAVADGGVRITAALMKHAGGAVAATRLDGVAVDGEEVYRVEGRAAATPIGSAEGPPHPFWKYLGLTGPQKDLISEEFLSQLPLFAGFRRSQLRHIRPLLHFRTYRAGERIFTRGEVGSAMYIIQRGAVDILQESETGARPVLLQRLVAGEFFGELALLSSLQRSASAVAYEPTEMLVVFQADVYEMLELEPELGVELIRTLSRILGERVIRINEELARLQAGPEEGASA